MPDEAPLTIDELARRTGMTVRNLRAHQSRGLLPAPEVRGRTGYYGPEHVARVELIKELQADGFNLEAIRRLIENAGGSTSDVLRFTRAARETFEEETPEIPAQGVGSIELAMEEGEYDVTAGDDQGLKPDRVVVGPERASSQNDLLLP